MGDSRVRAKTFTTREAIEGEEERAAPSAVGRVAQG